MLKFVYCLRKRADLSETEFHAYWQEKHGSFIRSIAKTLKAEKYIQSHTLDTPINQALVESRGLDPNIYDGVTEIWWNSMDDFLAGVNSPEGIEAAQKYVADEANFVDFAQSRAFLTEEYTVFDQSVRSRVQELMDFLKTNPPPEQVYEQFYDENVVVQENLQPPRVGRAMSIERQQKMNANVKELHDVQIRTVLVDGDRSVIEMHLDATTVDGHHIHIEELGMQTWKDGRIIHERFFYDPGSMQGQAQTINAMHS